MVVERVEEASEARRGGSRKGGWGFQGEGSLTRAGKQSGRAVLLSADGDTTH